MAKAITKSKTKKRQSTTRRLSSSSATKAKNSSPAKRKTVPKPSQKQLSISLPRQRKLTVSFKVTSAKPTKSKKAVKRVKKAPTKRGLLSAGGLVLLGLFGVVYSTWYINSRPVLRSPVITPEAALAPPVSITKSLMQSDAVRVEIPAIGVNAPTAVVGKMSDGSLQVPKDALTVGQYRFAPTPGEIGPAVLVGHVDSVKGPAVFWRLRELAPGSTISVFRADGSVATFRVDTVKDFSQDNFPTEEVYGNINYPGLRLITCGGTFNYLTRHYSNNTVVFASLVQE